ncbi:CLUMA_CG001870, isoform A [Clunio marinus]|uniref:CLUMA_CG001870, isoform A n=1 Tax=Clunio marinus TaxID=568069 RepID=A0A1J1HJ91_9DIPT|nr:CLUMA_CG001870, isoform A [Clunio marinus]
MHKDGKDSFRKSITERDVNDGKEIDWKINVQQKHGGNDIPLVRFITLQRSVSLINLALSSCNDDDQDRKKRSIWRLLNKTRQTIKSINEKAKGKYESKIAI